MSLYRRLSGERSGQYREAQNQFDRVKEAVRSRVPGGAMVRILFFNQQHDRAVLGDAKEGVCNFLDRNEEVQTMPF